MYIEPIRLQLATVSAGIPSLEWEGPAVEWVELLEEWTDAVLLTISVVMTTDNT